MWYTCTLVFIIFMVYDPVMLSKTFQIHLSIIFAVLFKFAYQLKTYVQKPHIHRKLANIRRKYHRNNVHIRRVQEFSRPCYMLYVWLFLIHTTTYI